MSNFLKIVFCFSSLCLSINVLGENESRPYIFNQIAVEHGLSNYNVQSIAQDSLGYLWIATARGLNRYNGKSFKHFLYDPESVKEGLTSNILRRVVCVKNHLFVVSLSDLLVYNIETDKWTTLIAGFQNVDIAHFDHQVYVIIDNIIEKFDFESGELSVCEELKTIRAQSFVSTHFSRGIYILMRNNKGLVHYSPNSNNVIVFNSNCLTERLAPPIIIEEQLLLLRQDGIHLFDIQNNLLVKQKGVIKLSPEIPEQIIRFIHPLDKSNLLIGTFGKGVYSYSMNTSVLNHYHTGNHLLKINSNLLNTCFVDREKNLWLGTFDKGLNVAYKSRYRFNSDENLNQIIGDVFVNSILKSNLNNELFVGTREQGVIVYDKNEEGRSINTTNSSLPNDDIITLYEDSENKIWIATYEGVVIFNQRTGHLSAPDAVCNLRHVQHITERNGVIYLSIPSTGISKFTLNGHLIEHMHLPEAEINQVLFRNDTLGYFCSASLGLYTFNTISKDLSQLEFKVNNTYTKIHSGAIVMTLQEDSILWVGTQYHGLFRINIDTQEGQRYSVKDGLASADVTAIEIDQKGRTWISTSVGLSCLSEDESIVNFTADNGIGNYQFHRRSSLNVGEWQYFGGNKGLTYFKPGEISFSDNNDNSPIITDISVNNSRITCGDESEILNRNILFTSSIVLDYTQSNFGIHYKTIDLNSTQHEYAYRMLGLSKEWYDVKGLQQVNFSNLPSGEYVFEVKSKNLEGIWSESKSLEIRRLPAPWFSWWAYLFYVILLAVFVYVIFTMVLRNKLMRKNIEKEKAINETKLRFFTNISHELRTPLTILHAIVNTNYEKNISSDGLVKFMTNIRLNTDRLKQLIDQLLVFRNLERDTLSVDEYPTNLNQIIENTVASFRYLVLEKELTIVYQYDLPMNNYVIDADKLSKILSNLLDNASKYSKKGGKITLYVSEEFVKEIHKQGYATIPSSKSTKVLLFSIIDEGIGIPKSDLPYIFDRYFKASNRADHAGTGIGLNFVKRLIELQKGAIKAESVVGQGTTISFVLPLQEVASLLPESDNSIISDRATHSQVELYSSDDYSVPKSFKEKLVLIVEDDLSLNSFLCESLKPHFTVEHAYNSKDALIKIKNVMPDIILSDIMMEKEDEGLELCRRVKSDSTFSHVPVILVTARAGDTNKSEGFSYGADAYITKPFNMNLLLAQIINLIENRLRLQEHLFSGEVLSKETGLDYNANDLSFIKNINKVLENSYQSPDFNINRLAKDMNMGRTAFYDKFTNITQLSPLAYVRKFRVQKAVELLTSEKYGIAEIGEAVGFSSRSGFNTSFKKELGISPSEYKKRKN